MLALFGPLCKTARKERSAIASAVQGALTARHSVIGAPASSPRVNRWGCRRYVRFAPKSNQGTDISGHHKGENFRQLMLQLMLHGAY
jgi:hypothetical protein